jgi:beta-lactamase class A
MQKQIMLIVIVTLLLAGCGADGTVETAVSQPPQPLQPTAASTPTAVPTTVTTPSPQPPPSPAPSPAPTQTFTPPPLSYLQAAIDNTLADFDGLFSYVIVDLKTGERIARNENLAIAGMSLVKIPLLVETYRALDRAPNIEETKLITQTTSVSSNFAANLLLRDTVGGGDIFRGADILTQSMRDLGLYNTFITVPYDMDLPDGRIATYLTPANQRTDQTTYPDPYRQTTIGDLAALMEMIYQCAQTNSGLLRETYPDQLTQAECREILEMMQLNELAKLLEAGLPDGVTFAHKVGWIDDTYGNVGIVFTPERDYLIGMALYYPVWLEWEVSSPLFTEVSRLAYAHFTDPDAYPPEVLAAPPELTPSPTPPPTPDLPQAIVFGTSGIGLTLRESPGGAEITILPEGTVVSLLPVDLFEQGGVTWQKIRTVDGQEGWVGRDYLVTRQP